MKKHTFTCSFFNQLMLITGSQFCGKTHYRLASKLLISFSVPKNHKINAFGSHLYMNLKKNDFLDLLERKIYFYHPIRHIHCQIAASEFLTDFDSWYMLTLNNWFPVPYNVVTTVAPSFLIGSSSYLQVTRTSITSRTSSKFGQIGPRTAELAALERLEKSP